jgi:tetrahydromethanopterin S-methyltransferase subunit G
MPDQVEPGGFRPYDSGMEARVAVLEHIAQTTAAGIERIDRRLEGLERRIDAVNSEQRADYRWLLGIMLGGFAAMLGVMAHGFHWL